MSDGLEDMATLSVPPPFHAVCSGPSDAFLRAVVEAEAEAGAATLVWSSRPDLVDLAVVFEPEMPLRQARLVGPVLMLAMADTLAALGPPQKDCRFAWPGTLEVDGAEVGSVSVTAPAFAEEESVPEWLVAGVKLRLSFPPDVSDPGKTPERTALYEEGFGDVTGVEIVESFSRHLLHWTNRWLEEGGEPVAQEWLDHLTPRLLGGAVKHGLDPRTGDLLLLDPGSTKPRRMDLAAAQANPQA